MGSLLPICGIVPAQLPWVRAGLRTGSHTPSRAYRPRDRRSGISRSRGWHIGVFDARTGQELKRLPTRRKVVHGVAVSPDDRYAFVSVEGMGSEPGTVEAIDLGRLATVGTVDVGAMAGGVEVWKEE